MEPTDVYYENLRYHLRARLSSSKNPCFELGIVDPGAVANNRMHHALSYTKEFIPIRPSVAMASTARESYATHSKLP
jgi:hypothetical protein